MVRERTPPCNNGSRKNQRKTEFYQDFFDIYWEDEADCGLSDYPISTEKCEIYNFVEDDNTMVSKRIQIIEVKDIKRFVDIASKYGDDLIIKGANYEFPACSLMSVMSLVDLSDSVKIQFPEEYIEDIENDFAEWLCFS